MWWLAQGQTSTITIPQITLPTLLVAVLIAIAIGFVVQLVIGYTHIGFAGHILVGVVGALLGNLVAIWLKLPTILVVAGIDIVWTLLGSVIFMMILTFFVGGPRYHRYFRRRYD